ncbi:MAG: tRNA pseudouridine(55) synthase TruB [Alphaproteobacteria bacterium]|nr:tRNA pseudouridine(55) synthase TruB [Alphaproteobacteria bacterium]MCD8570537.1 tRNA pseudouridine(55) synthase TruB [Alphaproteobacteria bacterium]
MSRKRKGDIVNGWICLDKPMGLSSTQAMAKVRRILNAQKAGHAGTLDPMATGILPIALGEATKTVPYAQDGIKTYEFTITWGEERDTCDSEGDVTETSDVRPTDAQVTSVLEQFMGDIEQIPPAFSAIKIDGKRAYDLARAGEKIEMKPRQVYIEDLKFLGQQGNLAGFEVTCGKGTYVRSLGRDIARSLGTCGHISRLKRVMVGAFTMDQAISLDFLEKVDTNTILEEILLPLSFVLDDIPALELKSDEVARVRNGNVLAFIARPDFERLTKAGFAGADEQEALLTVNGNPIALAWVSGPNVKPFRVFNL